MKKFSLSLVIPAIFVSLLSFVSADVADGYGCGMMGGWMMGSYGSGWMFFSWLFWILLIVLIVAAIYWLIKSANRKR
ncbi:MAG: hypothetical protein Q8P15_00200 [Nanoarchaeota archaeon]|nr:hypothetical protein [Nanoarchaeota archaeon]